MHRFASWRSTVHSTLPMPVLVMAVIVVIAASCTRTNPRYCDSDTPCTQGLCDEGGQLGIKNACVALSCETFEDQCSADGHSAILCNDASAMLITQDCNGFGCNATRRKCNECQPGEVCASDGVVDKLTVCNGDGTIQRQRTCYLGCQQDPVDCVDINPSNGLSIDLDFIDAKPASVIDLVLSDGFTVRSNGMITNSLGEFIPKVSSRSMIQSSAKPIRVFRVRSLTFSGDVKIEGEDAVAFVSDLDITIEGTVLVSAGDIVDTNNSCVGKPNGVAGSDRGGGGGGGFGSNGNNGGDADVALGGGGGAQHGTEALVPLVGGCGSEVSSGQVHRGGGVLQLTSRSQIIFSATAKLGALGPGGNDASADVATGGGSGGGLLLEAPVIRIDSSAFISANGGGGGGACGANSLGQDGLFSTVQALGANCPGSIDGNGGRGAALGNATAGGVASGTSARGGGGGGGQGRIRVNVAAGALDSTSQFSPRPSIETIEQR